MRIGEVPEAGHVALEPRQVLEVGRRRDEQRVDPPALVQGGEPLPPSRILFLRYRHDRGGSHVMELIHTCYRITDIDRSVAFYNALGF
ncbi:MAG: hypothetical protein ACXWZT_13855, partial [Gaiellaceae bacterium]